MAASEVQLAIDWAQAEGWNPGLEDAQCFYQADHQGFFLGLLNGEPIATGSAVVYDDSFAFCGLYIVKPEFRQRGYGIQLTNERLKYVGNRMTGLDGVLDKMSKYQRLGYISAHTNTRYAFTFRPMFSTSTHTVDLKKIPFAQLAAFDRKYFPAPRPAFLQRWIAQADSYALAYVVDQQLLGYGVIRKCCQGYKIGPLFADTPTAAQALFEALGMQIGEGPVYLDIPEPNQHAELLARYYQMTPQFQVVRMYRNGTPQIDLQGIYGITTFELG